MADLAITHIMQIATPESQRNTVFGVHNAICQAFSVMKVRKMGMVKDLPKYD